MPLPTSKLKAAEAKKIEAERLQGFLQEMLREEENKYCADCEQKQPRWASWNLGVFLCIRCAGLHRNLGVHISRVKSVTLDSWTPEQVQSMRVMGNAKARAVYENELPALFRRPQTDQSLEQFIRAKYEAKRYIMKGWISPSVDVNDLPALPEAMIRDKKATLMTGQSEKHNPSKFSHQLAENAHDKRNQQKPSPPLSAKAIVPQLIDFDFTPAPTQTIADSIPEQKDMNSMDDIFGPIVSAAPVNLPQQQQHLFATSAGIPTSISSPNLTNTVNANSNNLITNIFNTNADLQSQQQTRLFDGPTSTAIPNHRIDLMGNFGATQSHTATATNPPQHIPQSQPQPAAMHSSLVGSDLMGLDMSMCTLNTGQSQSASTMLSSPPPATDTKKSTNEILALFKK